MPLSAGQPLPVLTFVSQLLRLPSDQSQQTRAVRLQGVVTGTDSEQDAFFIQDQTGGVRVFARAPRADVRLGDWVDVEGTFAPGSVAPGVLPNRVRVVGRRPLPVPLRVPPSQLVSALRDGQWVEVAGIVRSVKTQRDHVVATVASGDDRIRIVFPAPARGRVAEVIADASVSVRGVCSARLNASRELVGSVIVVPDPAMVTIEKPAPTRPWDDPLLSLPNVLSRRDEESLGHRVRVRGTVMLSRPGVSLFIADGDHSLYAETADGTTYRPGDLVEVIGFPTLMQKVPALEDSECRRLGPGPPPVAAHVTPTEVLAPKYDSRLVAIDARLVQIWRSAVSEELTLQAGDKFFEAVLGAHDPSGRLAALAPTSLLRVTGVCILFRDDDGNPNGFKIRLQDVDAVSVLQSPSWWTAEHVLMLLVVAVGAVSAISVWAVSLRRRVRRQSLTIDREVRNKVALERRCSDLVENANDAIFTLDLSGTLHSLNRAGELILGCDRGSVAGRDVGTLLVPEAKERLALVLRHASRGEAISGCEVDVLAADHSQVPLDVTLRVIRQAGTPIGLEGIARDITERRRAEHERLALAEQLRHSQKMEAVGRLAGGIAHDFNNLLTVINGYSDFLLSDSSEDDPKRRDFEMIKDAGTRAASLTSQLLAFSRRQVLQPRVLDLNEAITTGTGILKRLIGEDVEISVVLCDRPCPIKADPGHIQQVIINLAVNARDAMPNGGSLTIETARVELRDADIQSVDEGAAGAHVMLVVSDTGVGMDEQTRAHVFEPFFTTKGMGKGTGLGLSTVYGIIKQCGGFTRLRSEPGRGTTFHIYFPAVEGDAHASTAAQGAGPDTRSREDETILVAEDEEAVRSLVTRTLRKQGYRVLEASNGVEALAVARGCAGRIDMLLTDVVMPEMNGKILASTLETERPGIKVLFVSGYMDDAIIRHGILDSDMAFLQKPFEPAAILRKIREVIDAKA